MSWLPQIVLKIYSNSQLIDMKWTQAMIIPRHATLTKADPSSVIIEQDILLDKSCEGLLSILKRSRWLLIDGEFSEGVTKKQQELTHTRN